jgi:hypothetical protein
MTTAGLPLWSTTAASNASADPAVNWAEGMAPSAVNDSARAMMASAAKWRDDLYGITSGLSTGGTSTAFTVTTNATYATAAVMSGAIFSIVPHTTSGAAPTLAVDSLTARALNVSTGVAVPTGALISGTPYFVRYKHSSTEFIVIGPSINVLTVLDIIGGTQLTAPANGDTLPIYDLSATANRRILVSDFLKVVNDLTEDTTPDAAADYVSTYDASAAAAKKVLLSNLPGRLPRGYIDGCILSNNGSDATNDIDISAGVCRDSTNAVSMDVPTLAGKQLDANWAPGASAGMRNSAVGIANGTYHLYAVRTAASSTADIYAHTSTVAATVITALQAESGGSAYIYARHIGSIVRAGATILQFTQHNDEFWLNTPVLDISNAASGTSANTGTLSSAPTGIKIKAFLNVRENTSAGVYFSSLDSVDLAASSTVAPLFSVESSSGAATGQVSVWTNTSAQVRYRASANIDVRAATLGWWHPRGKDS